MAFSLTNYKFVVIAIDRLIDAQTDGRSNYDSCTFTLKIRTKLFPSISSLVTETIA